MKFIHTDGFHLLSGIFIAIILMSTYASSFMKLIQYVFLID